MIFLFGVDTNRLQPKGILPGFRYEHGLRSPPCRQHSIVNYVYVILHHPCYREKYREFLKIDFPHIPYPVRAKNYDALDELGSELIETHLMESKRLNQSPVKFPETGSNEIEKLNYADEKVWINAGQYFTLVPEVVWNFYIGGYQPAQKWLKDRKCRTLNFDDITHYQKIVMALMETDRIMKKINKIRFE